MNIARLRLELIDAFLEFDSWTTAKKSALLYGLALPFHIFCTLWATLSIDQYAWVDMPLVKSVYWLWNLEIAIVFLISTVVARKGYEGRWTLWLNVLPYGAFMMVAISLFGFASSAFAVWFPSILVLVTIWYGPRAGLISFGYGLAMIAFYLILLETKVLSYAPALLDRSIDVQNDLMWISHVFVVILMYFGFCLCLIMLLVSAKTRQQLRLDEAQQMLEYRNDLISRYAPSEVAERILGDHQAESFTPERAKLTIFFSDIEGFTEASDKLDPEVLALALDDYLSAMAEIVEHHGSSINQFVGDGVMIFFGGPNDEHYEDHALHAVRMALDMQERISELQENWKQLGIHKPLRVRMGINTGYCSVGDFGSAGRKVYTAIGMQANIAARIQARCEPGKVFISDTTWALVRGKFVTVDKGELEFKGVHYPVRVYEVTGLA